MKHPQYKIIKDKIKSGEITMFSQIFDYVPVEDFARDLWLIENPAYQIVPETPKAKEEIEIWIRKLKNPQFSDEILCAMHGRTIKDN